jgi:predicted ATPase with chaperone activity
MALSSAARAALEQFNTQQGVGTAVETPAAPERPPVDTGNTLPRPPQPAGLLSNDTISESADGLFRPEQPKTFKESGISYRVMESLILKTIKQEGPQNEVQLAEFLKIGANVFREVLISLNKRELLDTPMPMTFDLTAKGRELVAIMEGEDAYVGPAPVSFKAYCDMVKQQAKRERRVTMDEVEQVFASYPMRPELKHTLKEGFNSQRVMLFYGPPGNGKSLITDNLHRLLKNPVLLPYCFEYNSKIVQVYDTAFHKLRTDIMER